MRLPDLVIVGVGKGGTTSLFWYLSQHPDVCASDEKEIRHFAALTEGRDETPPVEEYAKHFRHCRGERFAMEASPQYFHGGRRVADAMAGLLDDPRIIVTLRDPVDRLWSQFRFVKTRFGPVPESMTFEEYAERNERVWREGLPLEPDIVPYWHLAGGMYADHIEPWFDVFGDAFRVVFFEHLVARPAATVIELAEWLGVDPAPVRGFTFSVENRTVPVRSAVLQRVALFANREDLLGSQRRLKAPLRRLYYALNRRREPDAMPPAVEAHLRNIVAPANERLARQLTERGYVDLPAWLRSSAPAAP
jgi:Sulfotransferase domain